MGSILWIAIGIAIFTTLLGSLLFQFLIPNNSRINALEEKCEKIAKEGFQIHVMYPDLQPDELPSGDLNRLTYLDEMWINECVSGLPAESIFNIIQKVEHNFYSGQ